MATRMSAEVQEKIWVLFEDGGSWHSISEQAGSRVVPIRRFVVDNKSRRPIEPLVWSSKSTALATLVERKTRYTLLVRLAGRSKAALNGALIPVFETAGSDGAVLDLGSGQVR